MKLIASIVLALFVAGTFGALIPSATEDTVTELPIAKKHTTKASTTTSTEATTTTQTQPSTTSTTKASTTTTTEATTTTSTQPSTTPTTKASTTTTTEATTTTSTQPSTTPTTEATTTTTSKATTTTTPRPKPSGKPQTGTWKLLDKNTKETCIIVQLAAQLIFTYTTNDNKQNVTTYNIPVEETNVPQGHCTNGTSDETISVEWAAQTQNVTNTFAYTFGLKDDNIKYYLKKATYTIFAGDLYNGNNDTLNLIYNGSEYATPKGYSYHCTKEQQLNLTDKSNKSVGSVHVSHVQLQAFYSSKTGNFTTAKDCDYPETPDYVPIIVGISLIALVAIVLIGYLVGRRRAQASGYVSM